MRKTLNHRIETWLSAEEYLGVIAAADDADRSLSGYVRHLIRQDLALRASSMDLESARRGSPALGGDLPRDAGEGR